MPASSIASKRPRRRSQYVLACLVAAASPLTTSAATRSYSGGDGSLFATATNWNPNGVPGSGDVLTLGSTAISGLSGDLHVTLNGVFTGITSVTFDSSALPGGFILNETGGTLGATTETLNGGATDNAYDQSQGSANTVSTLNIAGGTSSNDLYALSGTGTALTVSSNLNLGQAGAGTLTETDGSVTVHNTGNTAALTLGVSSGSSGTYTLSSGTLSTDILTLGSAGSAVLNQSGSGSVSVTGNATLSSTKGTATYNYSGGTATFSSGLTIGTHGTFNLQSGSSLGFAVAVNTGGTLNLGGGSLGTGAAANLNGGTLQTLGHSPTFTSLSGSGTIDNGSTTTASTLTLNPPSAATFSGQIVDGSTKSLGLNLSAGTYTLSGFNTYSGNTTIQSGTLKIGSANSLSNGSPVVLNGGTLDTQTYGGSIPSLSGASSATVNVNGTMNALEIGSSLAGTTYSGAFTGAGVIQKVGSNTLTLAGSGAASTFTGFLEDYGGTLAVGATDGIPTGVELDVTNATLSVPYTQHIATLFSTASSPIVFANSASLITGSSNVNTTVGANFSGTGTFVKNGTGTTTFGEGSADTLANTGSSVSTTVNAGTLLLDKASGTNAIAGDLVINGGTVRYLSQAQISDSSNITVNSTGLLDLNGFTDLVGNITLGGGAITTGAAGEIFVNGEVDSNASSTTATISGNFYLFGFTTFDVAAGTAPLGIDLDLQAVVSGGFVTKTGNGVLNLSGNNTFANGLYIDAGVVRLANPGALNSTTPNAVAFDASSTGTLRLNGIGVTISGLSTDPTTPGTPVVENANSTAATLTISNASDNTYAGVIQDGSGGGALSLAKAGAGTLTLLGNNTFTGPVLVTGGTLILAGTNQFPFANVSSGTLSMGTTGKLVSGANLTVYTGGTFAYTNGGTTIGTVNLSGGTLLTSTNSLAAALNKVIVSAAGGTLNDTTTAGETELIFSGPGAGITVLANSNWTVANEAYLQAASTNTAAVSFNISSGVTLTNDFSLDDASSHGFVVTGGGTLYQNPNQNELPVDTAVTVTQGTFRVTDASTVVGFNVGENIYTGSYGAFPVNGLTLNGGTFSYGGATGLTNGQINITASGGTIQIESATTTLTDTSGIISSGGLVKTGPGELIVPAFSATNLTINNGTLGLSGSGGLLKLSTLTVNTLTTLDIGSDAADISSGSLAATNLLVQQAFNGGRWNGSGITSSTAAANSKHLTAIGVIQNNQGGTAIYNSSHQFLSTTPGASDILLAYTYYGDTNLDGKVDGTDYSRVDNAYQMDKTNSTAYTGWFNGDFNYDGVINGSDYTLIDNAFNTQGAQLSSQAATPTAQVAAAADMSVPEPTALAVLLICTTGGLLGRKTRRPDRQRSTK
jgi:fibronectin-binding autotransporter adhesin